VSELVTSFRGTARAERGLPPLGLTLSGESIAPAGARIVVSFSGTAPVDLPQALSDARVHSLGADEYRIMSAAGEWRIAARAVHVHREIAVPFYAAIPPRPVPLGKRIFWRLVLALAGSNTGMAMLKALRGAR
jgi:hypothetical protein